MGYCLQSSCSQTARNVRATGLSYYGYRYLDVNTGRWVNRDPIQEQGGVNLYGFVGNDGVDWLDGFGLWMVYNFFRDKPDEGGITIPHVLNYFNIKGGFRQIADYLLPQDLGGGTYKVTRSTGYYQSAGDEITHLMSSFPDTQPQPGHICGCIAVRIKAKAKISADIILKKIVTAFGLKKYEDYLWAENTYDIDFTVHDCVDITSYEGIKLSENAELKVGVGFGLTTGNRHIDPIIANLSGSFGLTGTLYADTGGIGINWKIDGTNMAAKMPIPLNVNLGGRVGNGL